MDINSKKYLDNEQYIKKIVIKYEALFGSFVNGGQ